jgi:hypothetical protein
MEDAEDVVYSLNIIILLTSIGATTTTHNYRRWSIQALNWVARHTRYHVYS